MKKQPVFKSVAEYDAFHRKHGVFGAAAKELKLQLIKLQKMIIGKEPKR